MPRVETAQLVRIIPILQEKKRPGSGYRHIFLSTDHQFTAADFPYHISSSMPSRCIRIPYYLAYQIRKVSDNEWRCKASERCPVQVDPVCHAADCERGKAGEYHLSFFHRKSNNLRHHSHHNDCRGLFCVRCMKRLRGGEARGRARSGLPY